MIDIKRDEGSGRFLFEFTSEARSIFASLTDKLISVVGIAGPSRSGKSFLLNALLSQTDGFHLGHSTNPGTKGIWMWGRPLIQDNLATIFLDTEGLYSLNRDKHIDSQILGITLLLSSIFIYNNFTVIDERQLTDIAAVIELTRWVKEGNAVPYFLWCVRDFALNVKEYRDPSDYLESILAIKQFEPGSEKAKIRRSFIDFFRERDCLLFVIPVEDRKIQNLDKMKYSELRPEFRAAMDQFRAAVNARVGPKRLGGVILNGDGFARLTDEVIQAFNSTTMPQVKGAVEHLLASARKDVFETFKPKADKAVEGVEGADPKAVAEAGRALWNELLAFGLRRHDKEMVLDVYGKLLPYFLEKVEEQRKAPNPKFLKAAETAIETTFEGNLDELYTRMRATFAEQKLNEKRLPVSFVDKIFTRAMRAVELSSRDEGLKREAELQELHKDIEAERDRRKLAADSLSQQRAVVAEMSKQLQDTQQTITDRTNKIGEARKAHKSDSILKTQLSILQDKRDRIAAENANLRKFGPPSQMMRTAVIETCESMIDDLTGESMAQLKEYLTNIKSQAMKENEMYRQRVDTIRAENAKLEESANESQKNADEIARLKQELRALQSSVNTNDADQRTASLIGENKMLRAEKEYFHFLVRELVVELKKKKSKLQNALSLFVDDNDSFTIKKILDEHKIPY